MGRLGGSAGDAGAVAVGAAREVVFVVDGNGDVEIEALHSGNGNEGVSGRAQETRGGKIFANRARFSRCLHGRRVGRAGRGRVPAAALRALPFPAEL